MANHLVPHQWPWTVRRGDELPDEFLRYLSDPEMKADALGGQIHWSAVFEPILTTTIGLFACFWLISYMPADLVLLGQILVLVILFLVARLIVKLYLWRIELVFITTKRIITVSGLVNRNVAMMPLAKLTDMNYVRTPMGYLLGYGSFRLESAGQLQAIEKLGRIPDPDASYRYIQNLIFGRGTTDVVLVDVKTDKRVNVGWRGRLFPNGRGASLEQAERDEDWFEKK